MEKTLVSPPLSDAWSPLNSGTQALECCGNLEANTGSGFEGSFKTV